ncbi:MAG TPA: NAD(P)/FAD-dependent oxidoreductase [Candidatus Limnocylindrales bacterium]|nr:NAD(P)/FAD-dependent oxidoreductase [Candidatus Limnocylindrales bacterium]
MPASRQYDAIVIGSGPNGLGAAITLAQANRSVLLIEGQDTIGGGTRSAELTLPGFTHDVCSAVLPMGVGSPFLRSLPLEKHGLEWIQPSAPLAHPLDDGSAVLLERSVEATALNLGDDAAAYTRLFRSLTSNWPKLEPVLLGPIGLPAHPIAAALFGLRAMRSASGLARSLFRGERARALFAGCAAHSILPLERIPSAAFGLVLGAIAHVAGWPIARGGSQNLANALASLFRSLGGEIVTGQPIKSLDELPPSEMVLCDVTPRQLLRIAGSAFPDSFRRKLAAYRYGPGVCKVDWALKDPIPWKAEACARAGTVHVAGTFDEIAASERAPWRGEHAERPYIILAQPTLFDPSRAPAGKHIAWAYCHVPNGSSFDMSSRIEQQIERFAPGFTRRILKRSVMLTPELESHNPNLVGGDITGGEAGVAQLFLRPTWRLYRTPSPKIYLCSASTPPGGGVHGLCGYYAARAALRDHSNSSHR